MQNEKNYAKLTRNQASQTQPGQKEIMRTVKLETPSERSEYHE
jgi:hypothetical protein